jgi:hypothetical protein
MAWVIYLNRAILFAVPFDLARLESRAANPGRFWTISFTILAPAQASMTSPITLGHGTLVYRRAPGARRPGW